MPKKPTLRTTDFKREPHFTPAKIPKALTSQAAPKDRETSACITRVTVHHRHPQSHKPSTSSTWNWQTSFSSKPIIKISFSSCSKPIKIMQAAISLESTSSTSLWLFWIDRRRMQALTARGEGMPLPLLALQWLWLSNLSSSWSSRWPLVAT